MTSKPAVPATLTRAPATRWFALPALVLGLLAIPPGCGQARIGGSTPADQVIDDLRRENIELETRIRTLESQVAARADELQALRQATAPGTVPAGVDPATLPRLARLVLDRYSGAIDTSGDRKDDTLRLYVRTLDQEDRFLPVAGSAKLTVLQPPAGDTAAVLAQRHYAAAEWTRAYRSGITGTHYTLEVPLPQELPAPVQQVVVQVSVTDAATGITLTQHAVYPLAR